MKAVRKLMLLASAHVPPVVPPPLPLAARCQNGYPISVAVDSCLVRPGSFTGRHKQQQGGWRYLKYQRHPEPGHLAVHRDLEATPSIRVPKSYRQAFKSKAPYIFGLTQL